jgi:FKBP-type peptidyl-prolyl cis-trans isomerase
MRIRIGLKNNLLVIIYVILLLFFIAGCNDNPQSVEENNITSQDLEEPLIKANKHLVKTEEELINDYIKRYGWEMEITSTGLRYMIFQNGYGESPETGNTVEIKFSVRLLSGELCYSSDELGTKEFTLGKAEVENGLEEGILLMRVGDKAKFIIPSHLAFGLLGDMNKIPQKATLVYDAELLEIK